MDWQGEDLAVAVLAVLTCTSGERELFALVAREAAVLPRRHPLSMN